MISTNIILPKKEKIIIKIINDSIKLCHPYGVLKEKIRVIKDKHIMVGDNEIRIGSGKLYVLGWGKAAAAMAMAVEHILGPDMIEDGVVVSTASNYKTKKIKILTGTHPLPTFKSIKASKEIVKMAKKCKENDHVLCLISGGGSALLSYPVPEIGIKAKKRATELMLLNKMEDDEINVIRKHLSVVKGGKLAKIIYPASIYNLIISDDVANLLTAIASGPTVPDSSTFQDALNIIEKHGLASKMPVSIMNYLKSNLNVKDNETAKKTSPVFKRMKNIILLDNKKALLRLKKVAKKNRFKNVYIYKTTFHEDIKKCVKELNQFIQKILCQNSKSDFMILAGGEIPIKVKKGSLGGRAQHFAALMIHYLKNYDNSVFAAIASDGRDYTKGIAGAIINNNTMKKVAKRKLNLGGLINNTNTYILHKELGTHLISSSLTGTNLCDIYIFAYFGG